MSSENTKSGGWESENALELVMLGAVLASLDVRKEVEPGDWSSKDLGVVVSELQNRGGHDKMYPFLQRMLLDWLGVQWKLPEKPLEAMAKKLKRNGMRMRAMIALHGLVDLQGKGLDHNVDQFFEVIAKTFLACEDEIRSLIGEGDAEDKAE